MKIMYSYILLLLFMACSNNDQTVETTGGFADIQKVTASGNNGSYTFAVTIASPDTGCEQYADWWEVLSEDGELIYRRILAHSHVSEQPFARSGGPVNIESNEIVLVRAHMNNTGYGGIVLKGTPESGFIPADISPDFANNVETEAPQPSDCQF